jgi:peroxiredoxin
MKNIIWLATLMLLITSTIFTQDKMLSVGQPAPDFTLPFATKDSVSSDDLKLTDFIGKNNVILAFYPADWSGGCTKEVCTIRDNFSKFGELNAEVLAISGDYVWSHHEWALHHNLPFKLLSDHKHEISKIYNSYNEPSGYNKRTVYLIDKKGKIAYIDFRYSVRDMESFNKLHEALKKLQ